MASEKDIYISANQLIQKYGADALEFSMMKIARRVDAGDIRGGVIWGRIQKAIIELQNTEVGTVN